MTSMPPMRNHGDCGIAAIAHWCNVRYEDAYVAAVKVDKRIPKQGATVGELIKVAAKLGHTLKRIHFKRVDLDEDEGVLGITWNHEKRGGKGHWVVLRRGLIFDAADNPVSATDAHEYLAIHNGRLGTLLSE